MNDPTDEELAAWAEAMQHGDRRFLDGYDAPRLIHALQRVRADLAECEREADAREQFDKAIHDGSNAMMKEALGPEMYSRLWGHELERLGQAFDTINTELQARKVVAHDIIELHSEDTAMLLALRKRAEAAEAEVRELENKLDFETNDYQRMNAQRQEWIARGQLAETQVARLVEALSQVVIMAEGYVKEYGPTPGADEYLGLQQARAALAAVREKRNAD